MENLNPPNDCSIDWQTVAQSTRGWWRNETAVQSYWNLSLGSDTPLEPGHTVAFDLFFIFKPSVLCRVHIWYARTYASGSSPLGICVETRLDQSWITSLTCCTLNFICVTVLKHSATKITDRRKGFIWLTVSKMAVHPFVENKVRNPEAIITSILAKNWMRGQYIPAPN